ncbi:glycoside hydrolase family 3 N-terminal domain-containing protein [Nesterenkonia halotolerans]|uniref:beta-N-acetylhexosaminidase n=1 Tax=Nesterenkonia halotolerans TaxID=225325 RepID=A0ABR9J909_9MICC|nr:glycoside hydrolase family 3 N-terminal domain-containing protein [Nesterenkonia halotolerans]MBE1515475.1 beta-N-acetylhexosaminidase [Nesterenkonia halotolerans]
MTSPGTPRRSRRLATASLLSVLLLSSCGPASETSPEGAEQSAGSAEEDQAEAQAQAEAEARQAQEAALAGPGEEHRQRAEEIVAEYSTEELAGSVLVGEFASTDAAPMAALIDELHLAGSIIMGGNVPRGDQGVDTETLAAELETLTSGAQDREVPPMISVDQEGGLVTRVDAPLTEWPTPMSYGAAALGSEQDGDDAQSTEDETDDDDALARSGHRFLAAELEELGFTTSFAPEGDVTVGAADPTIGSRSFGGDAEAVSELAMSGIRGLAEGGLAGAVKHFPGHGSVTEDSHQTLPVQDASLDELRSRDWVPFAEAAEAGVPMIMMGHIEVPALEEGTPSSLSAAAYSELRDMGHEGVVVTDALNMGAIVQGYGGDQAAVLALEAGADLLLMPADVGGAHAAIVTALESGELDRSRATEAAQRVTALQLWQADLAAGELAAGPGAELPEELARESEDASEAEADAEGLDSAAETAQALGRSAITLVAGQCEADLAAEGIQIVGGSAQDRSRLATAAQAEGITVGSGAVVNLIGESSSAGGDIAVALDRPEVLAAADAPTRIALYGRTVESFEALARVLSGEDAPGRLPVAVGEDERGHSTC